MRRRHDIWDELRRMQDDMDLLFRNFFDKSNTPSTFLDGPSNREIVQSNYREPLADIWENDKEVVASVEIPGVDKKDIEINSAEGGIEIKVEKKDEKKDEKKGMYRFERSYSGFYRYFSMPENADVDKVDATYKNGVLEIRVPKKEIGHNKQKRIEVK